MTPRLSGVLPFLVLLGCAHPRRPPPRPIPEPFDLTRHIGMVFVRGEQGAILYTAQPVKAGTEVVVALPREKKVLRGRVSPGQPPAEEYVQRPFGPQTDARRAVLRLEHRGEQMPAVGIAIVDRPGVAVELRGKLLQAELDGAPPVEAFRACASLEGVHLTIWSGQPLAGRRLWHVYYYLGYDTAQDCTPGDV